MSTPTPQLAPKNRNELHIARKVWHVAAVFSIYLVYHYTSELTSLLALLVVASLFIPLDFIRQSNPRLNRSLTFLFGPLIRTHEVHALAGTTYLITGVALIYFFCPRPVVELTLLFLAFGDPLASYFGIRYGRDRLFRHKTLQGTLGAFAVCTVIAFLYFYSNGLMVERLFVAAIAAGAAGAFCEAVPIGKLDDNLTFPLLCAICIWTIYYLFGAIF